MVENNNSWRAYNPNTGEMCPHHHHSKTSARRCGLSVYGECAKAVKWEEWEDTFKDRRENSRRYKRKAMEMQSKLIGGRVQ